MADVALVLDIWSEQWSIDESSAVTTGLLFMSNVYQMEWRDPAAGTSPCSSVVPVNDTPVQEYSAVRPPM